MKEILNFKLKKLQTINIRKNIINERQKLDVVAQEEAALEIKNKLTALDLFKQSKKIAVYFPMPGEVTTIPIIETIWAENKRCYLPIKHNDTKTLSFARYEKTAKLIPCGKYKIFEPLPPHQLIAPQDLELVILPIVSFDEHCNRMGYGFGHYDQTFAFRKNIRSPFLIGIAYELQKTSFATNPWDVPLDMVITENKIYTR